MKITLRLSKTMTQIIQFRQRGRRTSKSIYYLVARFGRDNRHIALDMLSIKFSLKLFDYSLSLLCFFVECLPIGIAAGHPGDSSRDDAQINHPFHHQRVEN